MKKDLLFSRRDLLRQAVLGAACLPLAPLIGWTKTQRAFAEPAPVPDRGSDDALLDEVERTAFDFFWNEAGATGQVKDRALLNGNDKRAIASIAATGFGLAGLCIAEARSYRKKEEIVQRVRGTLRFVWQKLPHEHGFYYHFIDMNSGERQWKCEISSIDTSLLLCGVLTARQHFADAEIQDLATKIYERVDWPWMLNGGKTLSMGWHPGSGFLDARCGSRSFFHGNKDWIETIAGGWFTKTLQKRFSDTNGAYSIGDFSQSSNCCWGVRCGFTLK